MAQTFEPLAYFAQLAQENKLCQEHGFKTVFCSGPDNLEGIMDEYRETENFIVIDDTTDNNVHCNRPGWFTRTCYTVWVLASFDYDDMTMRAEKMELCRRIFTQMLSRMVSDRARMVYGQDMAYLALEKVLYKELGRYSFNGVTGLYFMVENDVPTPLVYKEDEWNN